MKATEWWIDYSAWPGPGNGPLILKVEITTSNRDQFRAPSGWPVSYYPGAKLWWNGVLVGMVLNTVHNSNLVTAHTGVQCTITFEVHADLPADFPA